MASGDLLFEFVAEESQAPASDMATLGNFAAATGFRDVLEFAGSGANDIAIFGGMWPSQYDGGGITAEAQICTDGTSTGTVRFLISVETEQAADNLGSGGIDFGSASNLDLTPNGTANVLVKATANVSHVNCGSPAKGEGVRFKVERDFDFATNTDFALLRRLTIKEQ